MGAPRQTRALNRSGATNLGAQRRPLVRRDSAHAYLGAPTDRLTLSGRPAVPRPAPSLLVLTHRLSAVASESSRSPLSSRQDSDTTLLWAMDNAAELAAGQPAPPAPQEVPAQPALPTMSAREAKAARKEEAKQRRKQFANGPPTGTYPSRPMPFTALTGFMRRTGSNDPVRPVKPTSQP